MRLLQKSENLKIESRLTPVQPYSLIYGGIRFQREGTGWKKVARQCPALTPPPGAQEPSRSDGRSRFYDVGFV